MIVDCLPILPYRIRYIKNLCLVSVQLHHKGVAKRLYGFREGVSLRQRPLHSVHVRESLFIGASRRLITTRAPKYRRTALNEMIVKAWKHFGMYCRKIKKASELLQLDWLNPTREGSVSLTTLDILHQHGNYSRILYTIQNILGHFTPACKIS